MGKASTLLLFGFLVLSAAAQTLLVLRVSSFRQEAPNPGRNVARSERATLQSLPEPFSGSFDLRGRSVRGRLDAAIGVIEFGNYECGFCRRFEQNTWRELEQAYVASGKVVFAYRHLALSGPNRMAKPAAIAADCAERQGRFWKMHQALLANSFDLDPPGFEARAAAIGLDLASFRSCIVSPVASETVGRDLKEAESLGLRATPVFLVGTVDGGTLKAKSRISGAQPLAVFKAAIDELLSQVR